MNVVSLPVVVAVDGSPAARRAVGWAAGEAERHRTGLRLLHAIGLPDIDPQSRVYPPPEWFAAKRAMAATILDDAAEAVAEAAPGVEPVVAVDEGAPLSVLLNASGSAVRLVLGAPERGALLGLLAGSPIAGVTGGALCPVVVVRGSAAASGPVVVGVDDGDNAVDTLDAAFQEAAAAGVPLVAVHAREVSGTVEGLGYEPELAARWQDRYPGVEVDWVVKQAKPRQLLLELSETARLVVVGSRGRGGFAGLVLGSTCHALIHHAACPVMVARQQCGA